MDPADTVPNNEAVEVLPSRALSAEEAFYAEVAYKEPVEATKRLEDAAKFLAGVVATTSGLFVTAIKFTLGDGPGLSPVWLVPFVLWFLSLFMLVSVLVPRRYEAGAREPNAWRDAFARAAAFKYRMLVVGVCCFAAGSSTAVLPLLGW